MTLNNPSKEEILLCEHGYPDYMREFIYEHEIGSDGTPHVQAWIKLQRQQRLSFVRKLYPRGHFTPLTSDEYVHNTKHYAQKQDETAQGQVRHLFHDPIPSVDSIIRRIVASLWEKEPDFMIEYTSSSRHDAASRTRLRTYREEREREEVVVDFRLARFFISPTYEKMWERYADEIIESIARNKEERTSELADDFTDSASQQSIDIPSHTHTHTQDLRNFFAPHIHNNAANDTSAAPSGSQEQDDAASQGSQEHGSRMGDDE